MQLTTPYFATAPGFCALCGRSYLSLGWWLREFPSCRVPAFAPAFLYALSDGRWVCGDCAHEVNPDFCNEQAERDADNHIARLDALEAAGHNPWHQCCWECCPPWKKSGACPLSKSPVREEILWMVHNCTCERRPYMVEEFRKMEGQ